MNGPVTSVVSVHTGDHEDLHKDRHDHVDVDVEGIPVGVVDVPGQIRVGDRVLVESP